MINLISVVGDSAKHLHLQQQYTSDFKSLIRTITSHRIMIVSTKFRSDLFYCSKKSKSKAILKLWALYTRADLSQIDKNDLITIRGDKKSLSKYFLSINQLSTDLFQYRRYKKVLRTMCCNDQCNPVINTVLQCDQYLTDQEYIHRRPLVNPDEKVDKRLTNDTFTMAMDMINNETHDN